jgi:hypothetical protein
LIDVSGIPGTIGVSADGEPAFTVVDAVDVPDISEPAGVSVGGGPVFPVADVPDILAYSLRR